MLLLLLRTSQSADTSEYALDETYELPMVQELVDTAIDRGQPFRVSLASGASLPIYPAEYRLIAVVEARRLNENRQRFRWR